MQETRQGSVTLVLGGVRSGKSRYAQQLAEQSSRVVFVATAKISDDEMRAKIERHKEDRPTEWLTVEEPLELPKVLAEHELNSDVIVVDCLTVYTANLMEALGEDHDALERRVQTLCDALREVNCRVIVVSNEVALCVAVVVAAFVDKHTAHSIKRLTRKTVVMRIAISQVWSP